MLRSVITNYEDAHVVWLEKGRKSGDLKRAHRQCGNGVDGIETVAMDFWAAYLEKLKKENEPLYDLYLLKEDFLDIFQAGKNRTEAKEDILKWVEVVLATKYKKLKQFARSVIKRLDTILNWFDVPKKKFKREYEFCVKYTYTKV